jgi:hypothetical protein
MVLKGIFATYVSRDTIAHWSRSFKVKELSWLFGIIFSRDRSVSDLRRVHGLISLNEPNGWGAFLTRSHL